MSPLPGAQSVTKAVGLYDRQQFYANRASQIKAPKTYQIGVEDKVAISQDAYTRAAGKTPPPKPGRVETRLTYDNPREAARAKSSRSAGRERVAPMTSEASAAAAYEASAAK